MIKYLLVFVAIIGIAVMFYPLVEDFGRSTELHPLAQDYVSGSVTDLNMPNSVTAVVVTYRGLDTLGEVTVLFLATAGVGFLLSRKNRIVAVKRHGSEFLKTGASFLSPLIIIFGVYIFTHGHLSPGGGFQGGVVVASAILLMVLADLSFTFSHGLLHFSESLSGTVYVLLGLLGVILIGADSFLDPRYLPMGVYLSLFSSGAVPLIYSFIGIKVGAELSSIIDSLHEEGGD